jgi:hypothetical protein
MIPAALLASDVKARYTSLRRTGRQYLGLCPLHSERHPSFYIHPDKKIFYCFGCGFGGDIFDFVQRAEDCDFLEALRIVAEFHSWGSPRERAREARERFRAGEGAKPLGLRSKPFFIARPTRVESRAWVLASLDATDRRLRAIEATNRATSAALATACEPERGAGSFT